LREELGVEPAKRTQELYEIVKADDVLNPYNINEIKSDQNSAPDPLKVLIPNVMGQLRELQWFLANTQKRVQNDIEAIEQVLNSQI